MMRVTSVCSCAAALALVGNFACEAGRADDEPRAGMLLTDDGPRTTVATTAGPRAAAAASSLPPAGERVIGGDCLLAPQDEVQHVKGHRYLIDRATLTGAVAELTQHPERWMTDQALRWDRRHGADRRDGAPRLRVYGIADGARCGIENGDRILGIQGVAVTDPRLAQKLVDQVARVDEIQLTIARAGQQQTLVYQVVERLPD